MESLSANTTGNNTFERNYQVHLQHLKLKGLAPKTIDAYARAIRRIGKRFGHQIGELSEQQLTGYFTEAAGLALVERGQARPVRAEVLLRPRPAPALGGAGSDQAAAKPAPAEHEPAL